MLGAIEFLEDLSISSMIEEREEHDTGVRYSNDEVMAKVNARLAQRQ